MRFSPLAAWPLLVAASAGAAPRIAAAGVARLARRLADKMLRRPVDGQPYRRATLARPYTGWHSNRGLKYRLYFSLIFGRFQAKPGPKTSPDKPGSENGAACAKVNPEDQVASHFVTFFSSTQKAEI